MGWSTKHVTKVDNKYYATLDNSDYSYTSKVKDSDAVRFYDGKVVAATVFTPESSIAYCTSCGENISSKNKVIGTSGTKTYEPVTGMWILDVEDSETNTTTRYYIDAVEDTKKQTASGTVTKQTIAENYYGVAETLNSDVNVSLDSASIGGDVRALKVQVSEEEYFWLTDGSNAGDFAVIKTANGTYSSSSTLGKDESATLTFVEGHNHRYNTSILTSSAKATDKEGNIYFDPNFRVMTYLNGFNYIVKGETNHVHYLECTDPACGLRFYPVEHESEEAGTSCSVCGYDAERGGFLDVTIEAGSDLYLNTDLAMENAMDEVNKAYAEIAAKIEEGDGTQAKAQAVVDLAKTLFCNVEGKKSDTYKAVENLIKCSESSFTAEGGENTTAKSNVTTLKTKIDSLYTAADITVDGNSDTKYTTTFKGALDAVTNGTDTGALYDAKSAVETALAEEPKYSETFYVKPSTVLPLVGARSFSDFFGTTVELVENTGWVINDTTRIVMENGFVVVKDGCVLLYNFDKLAIKGTSLP